MQGFEEENAPELDRILRMAVEQERTKLGSHPAPEELALYSERMTTEEQTEEVRAHVALCRSCASTLLELERNFPAWESEASACESFEGLMERIRVENAPAKSDSAAGPQPSRWERLLGGAFFFQPAYALSALLLTLSLALGYLGWSQYQKRQETLALLNGEEQARIKKAEELAEKERQISALTELQNQTEAQLERLRQEASQGNRGPNAVKGYGPTNPITIFPMDRRRNAQLRSGQMTPDQRTGNLPGEAPREEITLDPAIPHFPVAFPNPGPDFTIENKQYRYELIAVREPSGQSIYSVPDLKPDNDGYFSVLLPSWSFPPGEYRFKIFGHDPQRDSSAKTILIAEYVSTFQFKRRRH